MARDWTQNEVIKDLERVIEKQDKEIERLQKALYQWDALIEHTYTGSRQAMSDMVDAAQNTAQILYGNPPWPDSKTRATLNSN